MTRHPDIVPFTFFLERIFVVAESTAMGQLVHQPLCSAGQGPGLILELSTTPGDDPVRIGAGAHGGESKRLSVIQANSIDLLATLRYSFITANKSPVALQNNTLSETGVMYILRIALHSSAVGRLLQAACAWSCLGPVTSCEGAAVEQAAATSAQSNSRRPCAEALFGSCLFRGARPCVLGWDIKAYTPERPI